MEQRWLENAILTLCTLPHISKVIGRTPGIMLRLGGLIGDGSYHVEMLIVLIVQTIIQDF